MQWIRYQFNKKAGTKCNAIVNKLHVLTTVAPSGSAAGCTVSTMRVLSPRWALSRIRARIVAVHLQD